MLHLYSSTFLTPQDHTFFLLTPPPLAMLRQNIAAYLTAPLGRSGPGPEDIHFVRVDQG